jgi:hypothetical protein
MKAKYKNTGTKEFPFYTITFNDEYYCATDDVLKAKNLVRLLTIPVVVGRSEQCCDKCGSEYYHRYKCVNTKCENCIIND